MNASAAWVITGMIRNRALLLTNVEILRHAGQACELKLVVVINDDDPLADNVYLDLLEQRGAHVLCLPLGRNASWAPLDRQVNQLRYAWDAAELGDLGMDVLVRSRADLWITHDFARWILEVYAVSEARRQRILTRGMHTSLPFYGEDLLLATGTEHAVRLMELDLASVPDPWSSHAGLSIHFARFAPRFRDEQMLELYTSALKSVEADVLARELGHLRWKMVLKTLPGGLWMAHQAALQRLASRGQLLGFLRSIYGLTDAAFTFPPHALVPGCGLDRGVFGVPWMPQSPSDLIFASSTTFIDSDAGQSSWERVLDATDDEMLTHVWEHDAVENLMQPWSHAVFIASERALRARVSRLGHATRRRLKKFRAGLPRS